MLVGATAGIRDDGERAGRRRDDEARAARIERDGVDAFLARVAGPAAVRLAARRARGPRRPPHEHRRGSGRQPPPRRHRRAGAAVGPPRRAGDARAAGGGRAGREVHRARARRWRRRSAPTRASRSCAGAGHAAHLERPDAFVEIVRAFLDATLARPQAPAPAATPNTSWSRAGRLQHGDQRGPRAPSQHPPARRHREAAATSEGTSEQGGQRRQDERGATERRRRPGARRRATASLVAEAHGQRALARDRVGRDVAQVVHHEQGAWRAARPARRPAPSPP